MKKILNLLMVHGPEIENRWWHRLANVIIFGSTILVSIFAITIFVSENRLWKKYSYTAFNFESNYATAKGKEVKCTTDSNPFTASASCDGNSINSSDLAARHNKIIRDEIGTAVIEKICADAKTERPLSATKLTGKEIQCLDLKLDIVPIQDTDFATVINNQLTYNQYLTDEQVKFVRLNELGQRWDLKAKRTTEIIYPIFFQELLFMILVIIGWFIFWESIIYRALLYIIYGKKK